MKWQLERCVETMIHVSKLCEKINEFYTLIIYMSSLRNMDFIIRDRII